MEKKTLRLVNKFIILFTAVSFLIAVSIFFFTYLNSNKVNQQTDASRLTEDTKSYHVIVTGTYDNLQFMEQVYLGALRYADSFKAVLELYVPKSQAESVSLQELLDYCAYVNADGIIAYIDSPEETVIPKTGIFDKEIPIVTTGNFSSNIAQVSFIGNSNWELGKKIADETLFFLPKGGNVHIIANPQTANSNLLNSLQSTLMGYPDIKTQVYSSLPPNFDFQDRNNLFICLNDDDTIKTAQILADIHQDRHYDIIGFGNNELCQLYLKKNLISELIFLDPQTIGANAIIELFEYKNRGHANSYIAADVQISRAKR